MVFKFKVSGMTCAACSARVEKVTKNLKGVNKVEVNLLAGTMTVESDRDDVVDQIILAVEKAGYYAQLPSRKIKTEEKNNGHKEMIVRISVSAVFLIILMYFTMGHMLGLPQISWYHGAENAMVAVLVQLFLTLPVVYLNRVYYIRGLKALWNRAPNMDSLIAVGSGAALISGIITLLLMANAIGKGNIELASEYSHNLYFESSAMILTLITVGKFLEERAKGRTGDAIRQLMDLQPKIAFVRRGEELIEIPVEQVRVGDIVAVYSGGSIPVDGVVISGRGAVDQSALTGESIPVEKQVGNTVSAATINTEGYMELRAEKVGEDTTLANVIRLVEEAGGSKAPIARLADKIAGIFVPAVMAIAAITFAAWLIAGETLEFSLTSAIAVLVISCPCALGLATPVAIMVGTGRGASMGVLFKNAESLENLHKVNTVVLDKTGTLTAGKPAVTDLLPAQNESALLRIAAALESKSEHLFAKAIMDKNAGTPYPSAEAFQTLPGEGVSAVVDGKRYYGGNAHLMDRIGVSVDAYPDLANEGKTVLYFAAEDGEYVGAIAAADVLKTDSPDAVKALQNMHLEVIMLTGDNGVTANAIGEKANIDKVYSQVLPGNKADIIKELKAEGKNVLMVGDGINDAPALVTADVGMAIATGTDIAVESADVVIMNDSLLSISRAIALSKATIRNIKQNLFWAFFYNCLGIPVAAGVLYPAFGIQLSPMIGAAAMSLSSFFVVSNALRLRLFKTKNCNCNKSVKEKKTMEIVIKVDGMMCSHCKARVEETCKGVAGVSDAVVDLQQKQVTVIGNASVEALKNAIVQAGYSIIE